MTVGEDRQGLLAGGSAVCGALVCRGERTLSTSHLCGMWLERLPTAPQEAWAKGAAFPPPPHPLHWACPTPALSSIIPHYGPRNERSEG